MLFRVVVPKGLPESANSVQCVGSAEDRNCIMRRAGDESPVMTYGGQYVAGTFCPEKLREQGLGSGLVRLISSQSSETQYEDGQSGSLLDRGIFMQTKVGIRSTFVNESVTPGICRLQLPFLPDHTLALPASFENVDTSKVRFMTMDDAAAALQRYEGIIRQELETPSELDRYCALPEIEHCESFCLSARWYCNKFELEVPSVIGVEIQDDKTGDWSFFIMSYSFFWKLHPSWAAHFSTARQMASLIKALSDCKKIYYPRLGDLQVNNVPQVFAEEYDLPHFLDYYQPLFKPVVRLPVTSENPHRPDQAVHWIGRGNFGSTTRA